MKSIRNIFLVDDDGISNMINTQIIHIFNKDIQVTSYIDAVEAITELELLSVNDAKVFPDVILLDINMPSIDGWEFLNRLESFSQSVLKKCKIYMLTSSIDPEDMRRSKCYNMVQTFISKPLTIEHLKLLNNNEKLGSEYIELLNLLYPNSKDI